MENKPKKVSLDTLGGGAAREMFDYELNELLKNIADPNTEAKDPRIIRLEVKIKPTEKRTFGNVDISISSKLAKIKPFTTVFYIGIENGKTVAYEDNYKQLNFDLDKNKIIYMEGQND